MDRLSSVLLVVPVRAYRDVLAGAMMASGRLGRVDVAGDADAASTAIGSQRPAAAVVDVQAPGALGSVLVLREAEIPVVALGVAEEVTDVVALAVAGVTAYVTCAQGLDELVTAALAAGRGDVDYGRRVAELLLRHVARSGRGPTGAPLPDGLERLTRRERQILALVADGRTNKQIALELSIELATVKNHVHHILEKLDVRSRGHAAALSRTRAEPLRDLDPWSTPVPR